MEKKHEANLGDIINLESIDVASQPDRRQSTIKDRKVLLTDQSLDRRVEIVLADGKTMKVATSPREIEWQACATMLKDQCIVVSPWRGAEQTRNYTVNNKRIEMNLPYPVMGVRAASIREMAYIVENPLLTTRLPSDVSGPRRSMVPRDREDRKFVLKPWKTYPVCTDGFVKWFASRVPTVWPLEGNQQTRPPHSWMVIAESMGPWGRAIGDDWIKANSKNNNKEEKK
uniref:Uncharacterized protein n=1 Tax=viral metagenome TaxID=1070528 RepID=A0A2V0RJ81_9ZZZZ